MLIIPTYTIELQGTNYDIGYELGKQLLMFQRYRRLIKYRVDRIKRE